MVKIELLPNATETRRIASYHKQAFMKTRVLILAILLSFMGCKQEFDSPAHNQEVVFKLEYINAAWSYQHQGIMINSNGKIWQYRLPKDWNFVDKEGFISSNNLIENLAKCEMTTITIHKDTLNKYYTKMLKAASGTISEPRMEMADAGSTTYSGYIYSSRTNKYKEVLMRQIGDIYIENQTSEAKEIYNWLNRVNLEYRKSLVEY